MIRIHQSVIVIDDLDDDHRLLGDPSDSFVFILHAFLLLCFFFFVYVRFARSRFKARGKRFFVNRKSILFI